MKINIKSDALSSAAKTLGAALPREHLSQWRNVRMDVTGDGLALAACNGDIQIERRVKAVVAEPGSVLVAGREFVAFASALPEGVADIAMAGKRLKMAVGASAFSVATADVRDWVAIGAPEQSACRVTLPSLTLRELLRKTRWAVSRDVTRATLRCVRMELADGKLTFAATDGRCLGTAEFAVENDGRGAVSLPGPLVAVLAGSLGTEGDVALTFDRRTTVVSGDGWTITSRVAADDYPAWRRVVPSPLPAGKVVVDRQAFLDEVGRAALSAPASGGVKVVLSGDGVGFGARADLSSFSSALPVVRASDAVKQEMVVDPNLLKAALGCLDEDEVALSYTTATGPLVVTSSIPWMGIIMPMREV